MIHYILEGIFQMPEAIARRSSVKKVFLKIFQNSQENTCARVSFLIKSQVTFKNTFYYRTPLVTATEMDYKMTLANKIKTLDDKIKANETQYHLDRKAANISALSSSELQKYEYLSG